MDTKDKRDAGRRVLHRIVLKDLSDAFEWFTEAASLRAAENLAEQIKSTHRRKSDQISFSIPLRLLLAVPVKREVGREGRGLFSSQKVPQGVF